MSLQRRACIKQESDHWWVAQAAPHARVSGARPGDVDIRCPHPNPASRARVNPDRGARRKKRLHQQQPDRGLELLKQIVCILVSYKTY